MINIKLKKPKSYFFNFKKIKNSSNDYRIYFYNGWNNLTIIRIDFFKKTKKNLNSFLFSKKFFNLEKAVIVTKGNFVYKNSKVKKKLNKFDCIHTFKGFEKTEVISKKNSQLFIVINTKNRKFNKNDKNKEFIFNFKKNLKLTNLWGGKCISRVFNGFNMTLVLFKLKKGFKFHDKGHMNEQITWLIDGSMKFYIKNKHRVLKPLKISADIGPFDFHGGVSHGALGFDVFSPSRNEERYL